MIIGAMKVDLHVPHAQSLKDKRSVIKSLKEQMKGRFNVAAAEIDANEKWQRATLGMATVGDDRTMVQATLRQVIEWVRYAHGVELIQVEEEYF